MSDSIADKYRARQTAAYQTKDPNWFENNVTEVFLVAGKGLRVVVKYKNGEVNRSRKIIGPCGPLGHFSALSRVGDFTGLKVIDMWDKGRAKQKRKQPKETLEKASHQVSYELPYEIDEIHDPVWQEWVKWCDNLCDQIRRCLCDPDEKNIPGWGYATTLKTQPGYTLEKGLAYMKEKEMFRGIARRVIPKPSEETGFQYPPHISMVFSSKVVWSVGEGENVKPEFAPSPEMLKLGRVPDDINYRVARKGEVVLYDRKGDAVPDDLILQYDEKFESLGEGFTELQLPFYVKVAMNTFKNKIMVQFYPSIIRVTLTRKVSELRAALARQDVYEKSEHSVVMTDDEDTDVEELRPAQAPKRKQPEEDGDDEEIVSTQDTILDEPQAVVMSDDQSDEEEDDEGAEFSPKRSKVASR